MSSLNGKKLSELISIQTITETRDAGGGVIETPVTDVDGNVYAAIEPLSTRELLQAQAVNNTVTHRFTIRHRGKTTPDNIILYRGRTFKILGVRDIMEKDRMMELMAVEGV